MLVLGRRVGQRVRIGEDVELVVLEVRGSFVRLGFAAPRSVVIRRGELVDFDDGPLPRLETPNLVSMAETIT